jgi:hypothetical protein
VEDYGGGSTRKGGAIHRGWRDPPGASKASQSGPSSQGSGGRPWWQRDRQAERGWVGGWVCGVLRGGQRGKRRRGGKVGGTVRGTQLRRTRTALCPDRSGRGRRRGRIRRCVVGKQGRLSMSELVMESRERGAGGSFGDCAESFASRRCRPVRGPLLAESNSVACSYS